MAETFYIHNKNGTYGPFSREKAETLKDDTALYSTSPDGPWRAYNEIFEEISWGESFRDGSKLKIICPGCRQRYKGEYSYINHKIKCVNCNTKFRVKEPSDHHKNRGNLICPHCWKRFNEEELLSIARHPFLTGDPILGELAEQRFKAEVFDSNGIPLDERAVAAAEFGEVMVAVARFRKLRNERGDRPAEPSLFRRAVRRGVGDHLGEKTVERESFVRLGGIAHLSGSGTGSGYYANLRHRGNLVHCQNGLVGVAHGRIVHVDGIGERERREERVERLAERKDLADIRPVGFVQVRKIDGLGGVAVLRGGKFGIRLEKRVHLGRIRVEKPRALSSNVGIHLRDRHRRPRPAPRRMRGEKPSRIARSS